MTNHFSAALLRLGRLAFLSIGLLGCSDGGDSGIDEGIDVGEPATPVAPEVQEGAMGVERPNEGGDRSPADGSAPVDEPGIPTAEPTDDPRGDEDQG